jgi:two-component system nitrate/nitrite sensor histidine kinase NarX
VPLVVQEGSALGALLVASRRARSYHQRQMAMLQTIASQVALVVQQVNSISELEYKTMMDERTRLAREIHDGLAQTLGFLKLKMAQMRNYLENGDYARLGQTIPTCYETLSDAYQDARQAIDGLRISATSEGLTGWIRQTIEEFQDYSGIEVNLCEPDLDLDLPPEVSAQLIRIVQEALSNIRKHAQASCVDVSCHKIGGDLLLEIHDNGQGFSPEDVRGPSQHGLRGMRERSELIGADFQVMSRPQEGTTISIRLAYKVGEGML